ncbi:uncharacterized protein LOC134286764 [Aedes albopictus]|uniref:Integrase catalytic domain-containing protein n=1 Tax=Aedes albopictus TaxID=7160 RepID=A0ABM1YQU5_AEDAL
MAGGIKDKIKKRERFFAALRRHMQFLEGYNPDTQYGHVQSRLDKLEVSWEEFNELQEEICELDNEGELEQDTNNAYAVFENQYYEIRAALLEKLTPVPEVPNLDNSMRNNSALGMHTGVRLPQISLPQFDGDYKGWLSFKSTFVSLIHESHELGDVQKFHYLKSALKGEAAKLIESLTITNDNYAIAWNTISKRYSNEYLLKKRHLQALMEFPRIDRESAVRIHGLVDEFDQRLKILKQLGEKTEHWGAMIVHWMCSKLDMHTLQLWEDHAASLRDPTFTALVDFLEKRTRVLDAVQSNSSKVNGIQPKAPIKRERLAVHASMESGRSDPMCQCCGEQHYLVRCAKFQNFGLKEKLDFVNSKRLCSNCFKSGHWVRDCNSKFSCKTCGKKHNSLIHPGFQPSSGSSDNNTSEGNGPANGSRKRSDVARSHVAAEITEEDQSEAAAGPSRGAYSVGTKQGSLGSSVFLSTVVVTIRDVSGGKQLARALLDSGSQVNVMSERLCQMLKLRRRSICVPITGVGQSESTAKHAVSATISSRVNEFSVGLDFLVLQRVTSELPSVTVPISHWKIPNDLPLADPQFNISGRIDLLLGADHFFRFLYEREMKRVVLGPELPILMDSVFGWIVSGRDSSLQQRRSVRCCTVTTSGNLEELLERFWKVDSCDDQPAWSKEEQDCEEDFKRTHSRDEDGRYVVQLPKHPNYFIMLGDSRKMALNRYEKLENRLRANPNSEEQYHAFMKEYLEMGHMRRITEDELLVDSNGTDHRKIFYLPHHAVLKEASTTTKVRVVFDASARTDSGYSLNDVLLKGPVIQDDLLNLLIRFRKHEVALVGDVEKMYRQVYHDPKDPLRLRIFFRFSKDSPIEVYELLTVTFGLKPSSFLATRALKQLAMDEGTVGSPARSALEEDIYIDDYIGGAASVAEAIAQREQLSALMAKGGFPIRKWCSNRSEVLAGIPENLLGTSLSVTFELSPEERIKTLGITWEPRADQLRFLFNIEEGEGDWTKRSILSAIARLFDPLGIISPIVVTAKIIMQELSLLKTGWDAPVPEQLEQKWKEFYRQLSKLAEFSIPRFAFVAKYVDVQLHCFGDASDRAYGACIYVRSADQQGNIRIELLSSKSRVAPQKRLTIPRLELCAAREAARLYQTVVKALSMDGVRSFFWSDSTVVLDWLKSPPNTWQTFVANRVSTIQSATHGHPWQHVAGKENPADLVSRGVPVEDFLSSDLWKSGPSWLKETPSKWLNESPEPIPNGVDMERRIVVQANTVAGEPNFVFSLRSSLLPLVRVVARCLRFAANCRPSNQRNVQVFLTAQEINVAKMLLVRLAQEECFSEEIKSLKKSYQVPTKSPLKLLRPFLDKDGIIRVGGRLRHSLEEYSTRHPAVLPQAHALTRMLVEHHHQQIHHGGHQATLAVLRQEFWPIHGKRTVTSVLRKCHRCFRFNPRPIQQPMGQLPSARVRPARPFLITGVDYCGPFYLKPSHRRGAPPKVYIAVFICFTTKAIHLELALDLSSSGFISALRRFVGHHGIPSEIHCDNATNFQGAKHELYELYKTLSSKSGQQEIGSELSQQGISWHFIPPRAPNFGGLWEAAVRSAKTALKKEVGSHQLTFENFCTLLVQISAALNSRPLAPLSDDPLDIDALTPAHFLIGTSMKALPDPDFTAIPSNRLTHYQQRQQMFQRYWQRWSREYLTGLQQSTKNLQPSPIRIGSIVVLREDNMPPLQWPLARIIEVHPGADGTVRVVTIRTSKGTYKRPVNRICPLPSDADKDDTED